LSVAIIINPISGGARPGAAERRAQVAIDAVERHGDRPEVFVTTHAGHARELARAAADRGMRLVIAWGGDGTINEVASALVFGEVPLAIVPAGSGNGLANELGVDSRPERAIASALKAESQLVDVGEIERRYFVNLAGIGFDAEVAARFNHPSNTTRGLRGYATLTAKSFFTYRAREYAVTVEQQTIRTRALMMVVANGTEFGNRILIARGARVDDGLLDVVVVEDRSLARTLAGIPWLVARQIHRVPQWSTRPARRVTIECNEPMMFHVDGEPVQGPARVEARIHPGALRVCV
jgi:YegS/Rv2252/BmrU family lipid kinase